MTLQGHLKACAYCRDGASRESKGMLKAGSSPYQDKLKELAAIIRFDARPVPEIEREKQYRLEQWRAQPKTKGASALADRYNRVNRIEREVKLEMLGKMIKGL